MLSKFRVKLDTTILAETKREAVRKVVDLMEMSLMGEVQIPELNLEVDLLHEFSLNSNDYEKIRRLVEFMQEHNKEYDEPVYEREDIRILIVSFLPLSFSWGLTTSQYEELVDYFADKFTKNQEEI